MVLWWHYNGSTPCQYSNNGCWELDPFEIATVLMLESVSIVTEVIAIQIGNTQKDLI